MRSSGCVSSTTPLQPPRRRLRTIPQPGNPLPNTIHHSMSARFKEIQLPHHHIVLRQVACKNNIACGAIHLPGLPQASRRGAAEACLVPHAFAEAAGVVAAPKAAIRRARARARSCQRAPPEIRRASASPSPSFVKHVDVALLLFSAPRPLFRAFGSIARITRGERLALLLPNHSLESF